MLKLRGQTVGLITCVVLVNRVAPLYKWLWFLHSFFGNGRFRCRFGSCTCLLDLLFLLFGMQLFPCLPDTGCGQVAAFSQFRCLESCVALAKHIAAYHVFLVLAQVQVVTFGGKQCLVAVP